MLLVIIRLVVDAGAITVRSAAAIGAADAFARMSSRCHLLYYHSFIIHPHNNAVLRVILLHTVHPSIHPSIHHMHVLC